MQKLGREIKLTEEYYNFHGHVHGILSESLIIPIGISLDIDSIMYFKLEQIIIEKLQTAQMDINSIMRKK